MGHDGSRPRGKPEMTEEVGTKGEANEPAAEGLGALKCRHAPTMCGRETDVVVG